MSPLVVGSFPVGSKVAYTHADWGECTGKVLRNDGDLGRELLIQDAADAGAREYIAATACTPLHVRQRQAKAAEDLAAAVGEAIEPGALRELAEAGAALVAAPPSAPRPSIPERETLTKLNQVRRSLAAARAREAHGLIVDVAIQDALAQLDRAIDHQYTAVYAIERHQVNK